MDGRRKFDDLLASRKFWGAMLVLATTVALYALDELTAAEVADSMALVVGIYMGSVALEDGLARAFAVWMRGQGVRAKLAAMQFVGDEDDLCS